MCNFCKINIEDITKIKIGKKQLKLSKIFTKLNTDVINYILTFLIHQNGHIIEYKSNSKYLPSLNIKLFSCSECFKRGIYNCLNNKNILPYLKFDINFFYPRLKTHYEDKEYNSNNKYKYTEKIFLPKHYIISYYKKIKPIQENGYYFIK